MQNTILCPMDGDYPEIFCLAGWIAAKTELDSWDRNQLPAVASGKVCLMILCTWFLRCEWRKLTIRRQRLFF